MKKILTAIDGSEASLHAARKAVELADALGADVTLAYVVSPIFIPAEVPYDSGRLAEASLEAGEAILQEAAVALGKPKISRVCVQGSPAETLAQLAETTPFDLVVVGSKGRGAVARVLVGSITDRLVHICHTPILVVR